MHKLTLELSVNENDDEIEQEICLKVRDIFVASVSLLDYAANSYCESKIERTDESS